MVEDDRLVALGGSELGLAQAHRLDGGGGNEVEEDLHAAREVEVVVDESSSVSGVGTPSTNLSVPIRVCTVSGVMIFSGIFWLNPGVGCAMVEIPPDTRMSVAAMIVVRMPSLLRSQNLIAKSSPTDRLWKLSSASNS